MLDIWPTDVNISVFQSQKSSQLIKKYIESFCMELRQGLDDLMTGHKALQQAVIGNVTELQKMLTKFRDSTVLDEDFTRFLTQSNGYI